MRQDREFNIVRNILVLLHLLVGICWVVNLFQLFTHEDKFSHLVGLIIPYFSLFTIFI